MVGILRNTSCIWRAIKVNKFSLVYGIISNNLKTGLVLINQSTNKALGYLKGLNI